MSRSEDAVFTLSELKRLYDTMRLSPQALRGALHRCNPNLPTDDWTLGYFRNRIRRVLARNTPHRVEVPNRYDRVMRLRIIPMSVLGGEIPS